VVRLRGLETRCNNLIININFYNNSASYQHGYQLFADAVGIFGGDKVAGSMPGHRMRAMVRLHTSGGKQMSDKPKPPLAMDHMTVAHLKQTIETRPQGDYVKKHLTTAHLSDAMPAGDPQQPPSVGAPAQMSVPTSPPPQQTPRSELDCPQKRSLILCNFGRPWPVSSARFLASSPSYTRRANCPLLARQALSVTDRAKRGLPPVLAGLCRRR
jgi:hypothetical protein